MFELTPFIALYRAYIQFIDRIRVILRSIILGNWAGFSQDFVLLFAPLCVCATCCGKCVIKFDNENIVFGINLFAWRLGAGMFGLLVLMLKWHFKEAYKQYVF